MSDTHLNMFILTDQHITLLRAMWVSWQDAETGAPEIDPKRPYGNSAVTQDIAELLNIPFDPDDEGDVPQELHERLLALHRETETALQVVLSTTSFVPGTYERHPYTNRWRKVSNE